MHENIKAAFRNYITTSTEYNLTYSGSPVINTSHPDSINIKLLGSIDQINCQIEEFCPEADLEINNTELLFPRFLNLNYIFYFPHNRISQKIIKFLNDNPDHKISKAIKDCGLSTNKLHSDFTEDEIKEFYSCFKTHLPETLQHSMFNCISFAFGIKEFIAPGVYRYSSAYSPEENVKKFIHTINHKYSDKSSNIMGFLDKLDSRITSVKCYKSFEEYDTEDHIHQNNDIVLYFRNNFSELLHGARFVNSLAEDIKVESFVSKLGHGPLVSHTAIDAFIRFGEYAYGNEL